MSQKEKADSKRKSNWLYVILSIIAIVFFISTIYVYYSYFEFDFQRESTGDIGGFVGGIAGSLFSCLAFIGVLWTYKLQQDELSLSREEMKLTREELERSANAHETAVETAKDQQQLIQKQQFESTFFSLLTYHEASLNKLLELNNNNKSIADEAVSLVTRINFSKSEFNFFNNKTITSYFIVLYQLLKFVQENYPHNENDESKRINVEKKYTSLVRAYIPNQILILLFFNCYYDPANDGLINNFESYKKKVERYSFFKHLSLSSIGFKKDYPFRQNNILKEVLNSYSYENSVFGSNTELVIKYIKSDIFILYLLKDQIRVKLNTLNNTSDLIEKEKNLKAVCKEIKENKSYENMNKDSIFSHAYLKKLELYTEEQLADLYKSQPK